MFQIKLVWSCFALHFVLYALIFLVFYLFPTIFSLNFLEGNQISSINDNNGMHDHFNPYDTFAGRPVRLSAVLYVLDQHDADTVAAADAAVLRGRPDRHWVRAEEQPGAGH